MTAARRDVIVFLTHVFDAEIERRIVKLKRECSDNCDIVVLAERGVKIPRPLRRSPRSSIAPR